MILIPKIVYILLQLPLNMSSRILHKLDSIIFSFTSHNGTPRISTGVLQHPLCLGGAALPDFKFYFWASQLPHLCRWGGEDRYRTLHSVRPYVPNISYPLHILFQTINGPYCIPQKCSIRRHTHLIWIAVSS